MIVSDNERYNLVQEAHNSSTTVATLTSHSHRGQPQPVGGQPQPVAGPQPNHVQSNRSHSEPAPLVPASTPTGFSQYGTLPSLGASPPVPQRSSTSSLPSSREVRLAFLDAMCAGGGGGGPPVPTNLFKFVVSAIFAIRNDLDYRS